MSFLTADILTCRSRQDTGELKHTYIVYVSFTWLDWYIHILFINIFPHWNTVDVWLQGLYKPFTATKIIIILFLSLVCWTDHLIIMLVSKHKIKTLAKWLYDAYLPTIGMYSIFQNRNDNVTVIAVIKHIFQHSQLANYNLLTKSLSF